jgi:hypothetical protein
MNQQSLSALTSTARSNRGRLKNGNPSGDYLFEGAALWGEDPGRRLRLPATRHAQWPLPLPRRQEHRCSHGRGPRPLRPRPPHPRLLQC